MKVGFTGTQVGMRFGQLLMFMEMMKGLGPTEFHHGDCIGADAIAARMVLANFPNCKVICHPPIYESKQAYVGGHIVLPRKDYMSRNRDIVDAVEVMIATPKTKEEEVRSGTWATVRYAKRKKKVVKVIYPEWEIM